MSHAAGCLALSNDTAVCVESTPLGRLYREASFPAEAAMEAVAAHRAVLDEDPDRALKRSAETAVTAVDVAGHSLCVKEFRCRGRLRALKDLVRPSPAWRSWKAGRAMRSLGLPAPRCLAIVLRRAADLAGSSFLVMERLADVLGVDHYVRRQLRAMPFDRRRALVLEAAALMRRLHEKGVWHSDLKASNLLVRERGEGWEFFLVDLAAVRVGCAVAVRERVKSLAQLHASVPLTVSRTNRLRFFRAYASEAAWAADERAVFASVAGLTARRTLNWDN